MLIVGGSWKPVRPDDGGTVYRVFFKGITQVFQEVPF